MNEKKSKRKSIVWEKRLVEKFISGDRVAQRQFINEYKNLIYNCIYRTLENYVFKLEIDIIDELYQETYLKFLKDDFNNLKRFKWKNGSSLATWISHLTRNLVIDYIRKNSKYKTVQQSANEPIKEGESTKLIDTIGDIKYSPLSILEKEENLQLLRKALDDLSESDKQVVELLYFQELSYEEIAKILDKSINAIYMQKKRVIEKIKEIIKKLS